MIVSLEALKAALGIEEGDTSQDDALADAEARAAAWVEEQTGRRFSVPLEGTEYLWGSGDRVLYLAGHIAPASDITVKERYPGGSWDTLTGFEQRKDSLIRTDGYVWSRYREYAVTFEDGYDEAPLDIQALVIELVTGERAAASGEAGLKSETIGEYSYTLDTSASSSTSSFGVSDLGARTLNHWRRVHV